MTTVYISGQMSGLDPQEVTKRFEEAEQLLESIGLHPVSPLGVYKRFSQLKQDLPDTPEETIWDMAMIEAIQLLLPCQGIFMLSNWSDSRGARIERKISVEKCKIILYESSFNTIHRIKEAIREVTGLRFEQYSHPEKFTRTHFARMIFSYQCRKHECMNLHEVASELNVHYTNASKYHCKYFNEIKVNKTFSTMAAKVDYLVNQSVSE